MAIQNLFRIIMETTDQHADQRKNLERFSGLVLASRELHDRLRATTGTEAFIALAVRLGAEHGCVFTGAVVEAALREQRRAGLGRWI